MQNMPQTGSTAHCVSSQLMPQAWGKKVGSLFGVQVDRQIVMHKSVGRSMNEGR